VGTGSVFLAPDATLDLHMHTRASDGRWTPETLVEKAASLGLRVMAVADHDAVDSVTPVAELAAARGIAAITGVEVTTRWDGRQWHVLIYGADLDGTAFRALVEESRRRHVEAAERAIAGLRAGGYQVPSLDEAIDGRPPLPIYVMSALVRDGHAATLEEANRLVTQRLGVPFYIDVPLREAVDAAHAAGGLAVLAHPGRFEPEPITAERLARLLSEAKDQEAPLDGLEVYYPTHTPEQVALYARLADEHGLVRTCGSDSHGPGLPRDPIPYPVAAVAPFLERCGFYIVARR
jgi:3',5'-nucleoside bisphosphate phosphatase